MTGPEAQSNQATFELVEALRRRVAELEQEHTARKWTEEALRIKADQLAAVTDAMSAFVQTGGWRGASAAILRSALNQTKSEYGFVGVLAEGPVLRILAHEGIRWDAVLGRKLYEDALRTYRELGYLEFTNFDNLFGRVATTTQRSDFQRPFL